ncbi:hypothetical protein BDEG_26050 [Batrachochytrium dendrobatidis JEL423]|uniref:Uncharacterized protein n=1 Tax=Batrachochytrium dendrobatidis (strain JEL423) TaxID=403673 RepID=A0A177WR65_BATDL|nr:hypothetical protein BDEG_26050 [Batrachochytrium dendrobatidis JEL423]
MLPYIGIPSILAKFRALTWFPCINVTVNSIYESVSVRPEQHSQAYVVVIDAWLIVTLVPNLIKFPLRNISRLEFDDHNLIRRHEDIWSLSDMFASLPIGLGWMYDIARSVNGIVGSVVIDGITWGFKNIHQGKKGNIYQGY